MFGRLQRTDQDVSEGSNANNNDDDDDNYDDDDKVNNVNN